MLILSLDNICHLSLERRGGPPGQRFVVAFQGGPGSQFLAAADAMIRLWAMNAPPVLSDAVQFTVVFDGGARYSGFFDMRREHCCATQVFQNFLRGQLARIEEIKTERRQGARATASLASAAAGSEIEGEIV